MPRRLLALLLTAALSLAAVGCTRDQQLPDSPTGDPAADEALGDTTGDGTQQGSGGTQPGTIGDADAQGDFDREPAEGTIETDSPVPGMEDAVPGEGGGS
jgi:hypothetical protein